MAQQPTPQDTPQRGKSLFIEFLSFSAKFAVIVALALLVLRVASSFVDPVAF